MFPPKLKAVARAVVTDDDELARLRQENAQLLQLIQQREQADQLCDAYSLEELQQLARRSSVAVSGKKSALALRLVQAGVVASRQNPWDNGGFAYDWGNSDPE